MTTSERIEISKPKMLLQIMKPALALIFLGLVALFIAGLVDFVEEQNIEIVSGTVTGKWMRTGGYLGNLTEYEWVEIDNISYKTREWYVDGILFDRGENIWRNYDIGDYVENASMKRGCDSPNPGIEAMPVFIPILHGVVMISFGTKMLLERVKELKHDDIRDEH